MKDDRESKQSRNPQTPDKIKVNRLQAQRLSKLANVPAKEIEGRTIAQLSDELKWRIDPEWFGFRRVCGQVVRWDPVTGQYMPVPFATVHVMDTECDFLGYFPFQIKWAWLFPLFCYEEQITEVVTDECGHFCVWVPWFDIDWVIRWRLERYCFPEIFVKPNIGQLLQSAGVLPPHGPGPDPGPIELRDAHLSLDRLSGIVGRENASRILLAQQSASIGGNRSALKELLKQPAFLNPVPPPTSPKLDELNKHGHAKEHGAAKLRDLVRGKADREYKFDQNRYIGPFPLYRCEWILEEELVPIIEVPDISFWVTQDTDGDGDQETIYSDGWFQVGWQSGPLSDVTLHASQIALINRACQVPPVDCETPTIQFVGLMPAESPYIDTSAIPATRGFAVRPNPPHSDGMVRSSVFPPSLTPDTPSTAPFMATLQLYGCNLYPGGQFYRLLYSLNGAAAVPFTNRDWYIWPNSGPPIPLHVQPDALGWYPILASPDAWHPEHQLLDWPTSNYPNGLYDVTMEIGDGAKSVIFTTPSVPFLVDNSTPLPMFDSLAWRELPAGSWQFFPTLICPIVHRTAGTDIEFQVQYHVSASHLLQTTLGTSGCGGGIMQPNPEPNVLPYEHWHINASDNFVSAIATFTLPGTALPGCYGFAVNGYSRAFNPSGGDPADGQAHDWYFDAGWLIWNQADVSVAVVDI